MNQKKLIGTIIGIIFFVVLIAGATFAWLSATATVTNGTYNVSTKNFVINYVGGGTISSVPVLSTATPATATVKQLSAALANNSVAGKLTITLTTESTSLLTTSGAINYVVCTSTTTTSSCASNFNNKVAGGTITNSGNLTLYTDTSDLTTSTKYYFVYFWVDASKVTNEMMSNNQNAYSGYIHASAAQTQ